MGSFVRKVKTASGATAVQIMHKRGRRVLGIDHIGSARTEAELALLRAFSQWLGCYRSGGLSGAEAHECAAHPAGGGWLRQGWCLVGVEGLDEVDDEA